MIRVGELYRNAGRYGDREVIPESWVRTSLEPRTRSPWSGEEYGYGWFRPPPAAVPTRARFTACWPSGSSPRRRVVVA